MREMFRILRPGGVALIMTPMNTSAHDTYEDPSIIDPNDRDKAYGEWDFVRLYGMDFSDRLKESGFAVEIAQPAEQISEPERRMMGI